MFKIIQLALIVITFSFLSSCGKTEAPDTKQSNVICEQVTINITNKLNKSITGLSIEGIVVGDLEAGETFENHCLESIATASGTYPYLSLSGTYDGEDYNGGLYFCGVGLLFVYEGTFEVEIITASDNNFYYQNL